MSSDGLDDVCLLVACCNSRAPARVEIPDGSNLACFDVNCRSVCGLVSARSTLGGEACDNTCVPSFNWAPLVQTACGNYNQAKTVAPHTLGYFGQILNIVCAASKSTDSCCTDMKPFYNQGNCGSAWAGGFMEY